MKIALPVHGKELTFFENAGHTPFFAVFAVGGNSLFKTFTFEEIRKNPRADLDDHHDDEGHSCAHEDGDVEHYNQHKKMCDVLSDCSYLIVKRACKNTVKSMTESGIKVKKYSNANNKAQSILSEMSKELV